MSRNITKEAVNKKLGKKRDEPKIFYGFLGNAQNEVEVPGRANYVYVTMSDGMVAQVYNGVAPSILNLPVICGYDQNQRGAQLLQVLSIRNLPRNDQNPTTPVVASHHKTHEWIQGTDIVYTQLRQFMPLRPKPVDPMSIYIANGMINVGGVWRLAGDQTVSLAGYIPDTGGIYPRPSGSAIKCKYVLISIDKASGSAVVTSGSEVGIYSIGLSDIPATPTGNYPVCAVMLYYYQSKIYEAYSRTDMIDLRWGMFTNGTSPTPQVVPVTTSPTTNQYLTGYNAASGSFSKGTVIAPTAKSPVANYYLTGYDAVSGSFSSGSIVAQSISGSSINHNELSGLNVGNYLHLSAAEKTIATQASGSGTDGYLTSVDWLRFNATSGSGGISDAPIDGKQYGRKDGAWTEITGGSQVVPDNHPAVSNFYLTGYDNTTGSFTAGSVVGGTVVLSQLTDVSISGSQSSGQVLAWNSGSGLWMPATITQGRVLLAYALPTSGSTVTFSAISGSYRKLTVEWVGRSARAGANDDGLRCYLNGDTTLTNYRRRLINSYITTIATTENNDCYIGYFPAASAPANTCATGIAEFIQYAGVTFNKQAMSRNSLRFDASSLQEQMQLFSYEWESTVAITSLTFALDNGSFVSGTSFYLYGEN